MNMEAKHKQHKRMKMDSSRSKELNFGFGFNDINFSDRVLRLEIIPLENTTDHQSALNTKTWHINSLLLAAKSQFFRKLFKNGMKESQQKAVTIRINESEEAAFMDLLNYIYHIPLNATSASDLVDVLMAADKFEVPSCVGDCVDLLLKLPMSIESALLYSALPSSVLEGELLQPITCAAKLYLASKDFTKSHEEMMDLPLFLMEILLGNDDHLRVDSEDAVYEFVLKWARVRYPKLEERREILTKRLARFICFQHMSSSKLKEVVDCPDFDHEQVLKLVVNALLSKDEAVATKNDSPRRAYKYHGLKVVQLESIPPRCIVYFEVKKRECAELFPSDQLFSRKFLLGGRSFHIYIQRVEDKCGVVVKMKKALQESLTFDCEMTVVKKASKTFKVLRQTMHSISAGVRGFRVNELWLWADFMSDESPFFIDGILCFRADITLLV